MLHPVQHRATHFAGMYAGVMDEAYYNIDNVTNSMTDKNASEDEMFKALKSRFVGYNLKTGYAEKQPVLPAVGYVSTIPYSVSHVGPGYSVLQTELNGHKVSSDMPIEVLAEYLTLDAHATGSDGSVSVVDEGDIYPQT